MKRTSMFLLVALATSGQQVLADTGKPAEATRGEGYCTVLNGAAGTEWQICDDIRTSNGLPAGGNCTTGAPGSGAGISDASNPLETDAFDFGGLLWVNSTQVGGIATFTGNRVDFAPQTISGLTASIRLDVLTSSPTTRILLTLANPGSSPISVPVDYATNFGSDSNTLIRATSSGDTTFSIADRWMISSESQSDTDPVNTTVIWGGTPPVTPQSVSNTVFSCAGTEGALARFPVTVPAGGSVSLMFFQRIDESTSNAQAAVGAFDNVVPGSPLLDGISAGQFASIVNFAGSAPLPVAVPASQGWTLLGLVLGLGLLGAIAVTRRSA